MFWKLAMAVAAAVGDRVDFFGVASVQEAQMLGGADQVGKIVVGQADIVNQLILALILTALARIVLGMGFHTSADPITGVADVVPAVIKLAVGDRVALERDVGQEAWAINEIVAGDKTGLFTVAGVAGTILYVVHHIPVKAALFLVGGLIGYFRSFPTPLVATRIDRASGEATAVPPDPSLAEPYQWMAMTGWGGGSHDTMSPDGRWVVLRWGYNGYPDCDGTSDLRFMDLHAPDPLTTLLWTLLPPAGWRLRRLERMVSWLERHDRPR